MPNNFDAINEAVVTLLGVPLPRPAYGVMQRFSGPTERPGKRSCWCVMFEDGRGAIFGCWLRGIEGAWQAERPDNLTPSERAAFRHHIAAAKANRDREQRDAWRKNDDRNRHLSRGMRSVATDDPVYAYLRRRLGLETFAVPECIRFHPSMPYVHDGEPLGAFACMAAPLVNRAGRMLSWHRTYLAADGQKAAVPTVRKLTPASGLLAGACIPLHSPRSGVLGIAEGIETAIGASCASGVPVVAAYSAGNLAVFVWPNAIRRLVIFGDNDKAGREAAEKLQDRARAGRLDVQICAPETEGQDWCDVWAQRGGVAA